MLKTKSYIDSRIGQYIHATLNMWIPYWTNTAQLQGQLYPQLYPQLHASCTPAAGQLHAQLRLAPSEAALSTRGRRMRRRSAVSSPPSPGRHDVVSSHQMPPRIGTRPSCQLWASSCTWLNPARWPTRHHQRVMCPDVNMGCTNHLHDCLLHVFLTNHHSGSHLQTTKGAAAKQSNLQEVRRHCLRAGVVLPMDLPMTEGSASLTWESQSPGTHCRNSPRPCRDLDGPPVTAESQRSPVNSATNI